MDGHLQREEDREKAAQANQASPDVLDAEGLPPQKKQDGHQKEHGDGGQCDFEVEHVHGQTKLHLREGAQRLQMPEHHETDGETSKDVEPLVARCVCRGGRASCHVSPGR